MSIKVQTLGDREKRKVHTAGLIENKKHRARRLVKTRYKMNRGLLVHSKEKA